ncbi:MAG: hypothetical protein JSU91_00500 [Thermoplasmatales archaeon]|nr:MAG: hypothetical protein JSU91_00500 [Thermoplasmatales archaeon]
MKRKIILIVICTLFIVLAIPSSIINAQSLGKVENDVEISISAGYRGKDNGFGVCVETLNHKTEDINLFVNLTLDYFFLNGLDGTYVSNETVASEISHTQHISPLICYPDGIKLITITAEAEGKVVTRSGISIRNFVFLFE